MNIVEIDRYCDQFEERLKQGESITPDAFLQELSLSDESQLVTELQRIQQEYGNHGVIHSTVAYHSITPSVSNRYSPLQFHARGGMGEVWIAEDGEIGRQVALKKLSRDHDAASERFVAEAQIAGQLEHPGIVPVHDLGIDNTGKPYYVMKFVHGRTLKDAIEEHHANEYSDEDDLAIRSRRLLEHFVDVCEAVAFAHTRGAIHRDLKPSNIMLGLFGETIVIDWGLAKVLNQPELPGLPSALTNSGRSSETALGSVIGTPSYMPPELADGKAADAGPATDIYLLGATLYEILTGDPPRRGSSHDEIVEMARTVLPVPPRQTNKEVARPLEAICLKAMAKREADRYQSAMDLAEEIRRYLAGEPVTAYREPAVDRTWRWCKRHRRGLMRGASASIVIGLAIFAWTAARENSRLAAIENAHDEIKEFRALHDEAVYQIGDENTNEEFAYYDLNAGRKRAEEAFEIAGNWGRQLESLPIEREHEQLRQELYQLLLLMDRSSDPSSPTSDRSEWAQSLRQQMPMAEMIDHFVRGERLRTANVEPETLLDKFELSRKRDLDAAIDEYRGALRIYPNHFWSSLQLGRCYLATGRLTEATERFGACIALRPHSKWARSALALALAKQHRLDEALNELNELLEREPDFHPARLNRGWVHWRMGNNDDAVADLKSVLSASDKPLILSAFYLGQLHLKNGNLKQAEDYFTKFSSDTQDKHFRPAFWFLAKIHYLRRDDASGLEHLNHYLELSASQKEFDENTPEARFYRGRFLRTLATEDVQGLMDVARNAFAKNPSPANRELFRRNRALQTRTLELALEELKDAETKLHTVGLYYELGTVHQRLGQLENADEALRKGLRIDSDSLRLLYKRGEVLYFLDQYEDALQNFTRATTAVPEKPSDDVFVPYAHSWSGIIHTKQGRANEALRQAELSLSELFDISTRDKNKYSVFHNLACIYGGASQLDDENRKELQSSAIKFLGQAVKHARAVGKLSRELQLISSEEKELFDDALKARPEFKDALLAK